MFLHPPQGCVNAGREKGLWHKRFLRLGGYRPIYGPKIFQVKNRGFLEVPTNVYRKNEGDPIMP